MTYLSGHVTGLPDWGDFTVMQGTGQVVVMDGATLSLTIFTVMGEELIEREIQSPCKHVGVRLLSLVTEEREKLVISCYECKDIKLVQLNTAEVTTTFSSESNLGLMCHGDKGRLFVKSDKSVLELDCSNVPFKGPSSIIKTGLDKC